MPLFDPIRSELLLHQQNVNWNRFVLSDRTRHTSIANQYNHMMDAIRRTEFEPWKRLRQNLRASCENDLLAAGFDERLVTNWLGHTISISRQHYQSLSDSDYQAAILKARPQETA